MKKIRFVLTILLLQASSVVLAGKDISGASVNYVYQWDSEGTVFEFEASVPHACGSSLYRVTSPSETVANRKFSLVLSAFMADKKLAFHDKEQCEGARSIVTWVRITN